jgi:chromate transporter
VVDEPSLGRSRLTEVAALFLKLGVIGFGGPAAHIALMRDEVVRRRGWLRDDEFLEMVGATNLIPGPNSTELAIHLGHRRAGVRGLLVAGLCFIAPAALIVGVLAWLYREHGTDPTVVDLRYGVLPVVIAIVANALVGLARTALTAVLPVLLAVGAAAGFLLGVNELSILIACGVLAALWAGRNRFRPNEVKSWLGPMLMAPVASGAPVSLGRLLVVFLEIGSVLYGSGYVLLAFLQRLLVDDLGWLTGQQVLDAITVGQVTPGPVFTTATFVGWQVDGLPGAVVATFGIFAPSFLFVGLLGRIVPWMRQRPMTKAFLDGVTVASLGLMAGVLVRLAGQALVDPLTIGVAAAALAALVFSKVNSAWLIALGALLGLAHSWG